MLTKEDLINIRVVVHEELSGLEKGMIRLEERVTRLERAVVRLEERVTSLEERVTSLEERMTSLEERVTRLEERVTRLEESVTRLEERVTSLENRMTSAEGEIAYIKENMVTKKEFNALSDRVDQLEDDFQKHFQLLEGKVDRLSDHSHNKFMLIENDMMPKIIALYDRTDSCVEEGKCRERREQIEEQLDNIPPLKAATQSHSKQLARHNDILENLITDAG